MVVSRQCSRCGKDIPSESLEVLPNTHYCTSCSNDSKMLGLTSYDSEGNVDVIPVPANVAVAAGEITIS